MSNLYKYKGILTRREIETWQSWQLVYEWEDILFEKMNLPLISAKRKWYQRRRYGYYILRHLFCWLKLDNIYQPRSLYIYYQMLIQNEMDFAPWMQKKIVPWIIDAFIDESDLSDIYKKYEHCPFLLISSLEAYDFLKEKKCPLKIYYAPLSISDVYHFNKETLFSKKYDLISAGRINPVLEEYVKKYSEENDINFVYFKIEEGQFYYISTKTGEIGVFNTREEYLGLLKQCKVALYSTPGIDGGSRTNNKGMNPLTPRFFELIASQCHIIARYPDTVETRFFEISDIAPHIDSYEEFKKQMNIYLQTDIDLEKYDNYLKKHYTTTRVKYLQDALNDFNLKMK